MVPETRKAALLAIALLTGCGVDADGFRGLLPMNFPVQEIVFLRSESSECAVAVFSLDTSFAELVERGGTNFLDGLTRVKLVVGDYQGVREYAHWQQTPMEGKFGEMSDEMGGAWRGSICIKASEFEKVYEEAVYKGSGAFFSTSNRNDIVIVVPSRRVLFIVPDM